MHALAGVLSVALALAQSPTPHAIEVPAGFLDGTKYRALSNAERHAYVAGLADGMLAASLVAARPGRVDWLSACLSGMTDEQIAAIISKWLTDHPERWHLGLNTTAFSAFRDACPGMPEGK